MENRKDLYYVREMYYKQIFLLYKEIRNLNNDNMKQST